MISSPRFPGTPAISADGIRELRRAYGGVSSLTPDGVTKLRRVLATMPTDALEVLQGEGIRWVSVIARNIVSARPS